MPSTLDQLPVAVQYIVGILGGIIGIAIMVFGWLKPLKPGSISKDVIVPNVNVMDGEILRAAAQALRDSIAREDQRERAVRELVDCARTENVHLRDIVGISRDILAQLRRNGDVMESIDERMKDEYFTARREREMARRHEP